MGAEEPGCARRLGPGPLQRAEDNCAGCGPSVWPAVQSVGSGVQSRVLWARHPDPSPGLAG